MNDVNATLKIHANKTSRSLKNTKDGQIIEEKRSVTLKGSVDEDIDVSITFSGGTIDIKHILGEVKLKTEMKMSLELANFNLSSFDEDVIVDQEDKEFTEDVKELIEKEVNRNKKKSKKGKKSKKKDEDPSILN